MQTESFIPGKDASLESSIATMLAKLEKLGFHVEQRSWLNPVDGVWSVHVRDRDCALLFTNGKGGSRLAALASALGEFFERLSCNYFWTHYYLGDQFGCRDFAHYPRIAAGIRDLREAGFGILVKDASLGGEYPVMNVTLLHPGDQGCFSSFGAHPRFEIALERSLTELLQGRGLDALAGFPPPGFDLDEIAAAPNIEIHFVDSSGIISWNFLGATPDFEFCDWNFSSTTAEDYHWLVDRVHRSGHDIYVADFTHLGVYACRILVPGMSEIYPLDELEWENNSVGNLIREAILHLPELDDEECDALLETLNEFDLPDQRPVATLIGLAAEADSFWADLRVGELKTLLALAVGDEEAIREGCEWVRHFEQIDPARRLVYRCIETLLELGGADGHRKALEHLYGRTTLATAEAMLNGEQRCFGIEAPGLALKGCGLHQSLLAAYAKLSH